MKLPEDPSPWRGSEAKAKPPSQGKERFTVPVDICDVMCLCQSSEYIAGFVFPRIVGKHPKMDGENDGKPY